MKREEHAARINEAWQKGVDAVIETGLRIIDARKGLDVRRVSSPWSKATCLLSRQTAHKLVSIASNKVLSNVAHVRHLPPSWGTLSELAVVANKGLDLEAGIESGAIHPRMERKDVKALLPPPPQRDDDLEEPDDEDDPKPERAGDQSSRLARGRTHRGRSGRASCTGWGAKSCLRHWPR